MGNLGESLRKKIKSLGIERQVEAVGVVEKATKEIAKLIPEEDFEVVSFNRGTLKILVESSSLACELRATVESKLQRLIPEIEKVFIKQKGF